MRQATPGARRRAVVALVGLLSAVLPLAACAEPAPRASLPLRSSAPFSPAGTAAVPDRWWTAFADARLDARVEAALSDNFSLVAAWERLREAEALVRREASALQPRLDGLASAERAGGTDVADTTLLRVGLEAGYEVDLWGRIRSLVDAEALRAAATEADYRTAALSLSAEVALSWYELAEARQQLELIASQVDTNLTVQRLLEDRFGVGQSGAADVLRQRQLVEATREQAVVAHARVAVLEHRLAVLEGRAPQEAVPHPAARLPVVPEAPATGLPARLLERRPDVRAAFLQLEAADADVAAAVRDQYPRLELTARYDRAGQDASDLFQDWIGTLAGELVAPLFDGGLREAEVDRSVAVRRQRLAEYGDTVLAAFGEVEDALALEARQVERIDSLQRQLDLAVTTYRQLRTQYLNGATDFLDVLAALQGQQALERSLLTAELDRVALRIALYRSLAGGFATPRDAS